MPVSLSYEYDPCIIEKSRELYAAEQGETYLKAEFEDLDSIQKGLLGYKGRVQVNFGDPIGSDFETPEDLAKKSIVKFMLCIKFSLRILLLGKHRH